MRGTRARGRRLLRHCVSRRTGGARGGRALGCASGGGDPALGRVECLLASGTRKAGSSN